MFWINVKSIFYQYIKTLEDKNAAKNMKRDSVGAYVHMRRQNSSPYTQLYAF